MSNWTGIDPAAWGDKAERIMTALLRNSVQALANEASKTIPNGGRVPIKTGNLARSLVIDNKPPMQITGPARQQDFALGVSKIMPGQTIYIGWTAKYSARINFGFVGDDSLGRTYNQSGYGFAEAAAAQWPRILNEQAARLRNR